MSKTSETRNGEQVFLLAAAMAALAAIFMVTIWAPMQVRAFTHATAAAQLDSRGAGSDAWQRVPFVTADGNTTSLAGSNGQVRVVTMLYTHCPGVCPMAVSTLQQLQGRLSPVEQRKLSIIALSLDPQRDSIARLQEFRAARGIGSPAPTGTDSPAARSSGSPAGRSSGLPAAPGSGSPRWVFGHPSTEGVRQLAGALGVSYRLLGDDSIDHQSVFVLLGKSGQVLARSSNTRSLDPAFLNALRAALSSN